MEKRKVALSKIVDHRPFWKLGTSSDFQDLTRVDRRSKHAFTPMITFPIL